MNIGLACIMRFSGLIYPKKKAKEIENVNKKNNRINGTCNQVVLG